MKSLLYFFSFMIVLIGHLYSKKSYEKTKLKDWSYYENVFQKEISKETRESFVKKRKTLKSVHKKNSVKNPFWGGGVWEKNFNPSFAQSICTLSDPLLAEILSKEKNLSQNYQKICKKKSHKNIQILEIKGVITVSGRQRVCFRNKNNGKTYILGEKEKKDGFFIEEIRKSEVCFVVNKKKIIVKRRFKNSL